MKLIALLAVLLCVCAVVVRGETDSCQSTTELVKIAARIANAWRATCEDGGWKGAGCLNYWAQLDELSRREYNLQECLMTIAKNNSAYLLGSGTTAGVFKNDGIDFRTLDNATNAPILDIINSNPILSVVSNSLNNADNATYTYVENTQYQTRVIVGNTGVDVRSNVSAEENNTRSSMLDSESTTRSSFNGVQSALALLLSQETAQMGGMWDSIVTLLTHIDLQCDNRDAFADTNTFQLPNIKGGKFDTLRAVVYDTIVYNENYYGSCGNSRSYYNTGAGYAAIGNYRVAADYFRRAYTEATVPQSDNNH